MLVVRPAIGLSKTNRNFSVVSGAGLPNAKVALVTNTGGGLLTGLESVINYTGGQPTGWDGDDRFEMYYYTNTFTQQSGMTGQVAFPDPTIQQLLCRFGNSATWQGDYWLGTVPHWAAFQFFSDGTYKLFDDGVLLQTGTYSLVSRNPHGFNVTFSASGGAAQGILYELGGYFYMRNGPASWPLIQYVLQ